MKAAASRSVPHVTQRQSYTLSLEVKITHNPGNKILKKADIEDEYEGVVSVKVADKGFTMRSKIEKSEDFSDLANRLTKLAVFKLADQLYPSKKVYELKLRKTDDEG